ncbi:DUF4384 domain-containing protein [Deinococcus maricopensis]|uniref:DUF4384 domain-containing protein n=1 Tax=Deinococcus maricopensis (strain DSM 21211 / LMG 22137 / NRRL B-23946 / LB-34) TaxID=709986 RepID=E8UBU4_DEIML|nr:DUF4384 domain-containing protein [Deinococcus maricopensis]ADV68533.1 hypothetical protein Deima_2904 [Deinococcus maricopensis DSM 21211]
MKQVLLLGTLALGLSACTINVRPNLGLATSSANLITDIRPDRGEGSTYAIGERLRLRVQTRAAGYLTLVSLDPNGNGNVLIRNAYVPAGTTTFPRPTDAFTFDVAPPRGLQRVRAIFTRSAPSTQLVFNGTYDQGRWNSVTQAYVEPYSAQDRDIQETFFYIR